MLTSDEIEAAKAAGTLFPLRGGSEWSAKARAVLMCKPMRDALVAGRALAEEKERNRWAQLEAAMIHFVEGGRMTAKLIKQLSPPKFEHWEIRNLRPRPSLRVFGRFALPDIFIATHVRLRKELGGMNSPQFEHEKLVCEQFYCEAGLTAVYSDNPNFRYETYITENASATIKVPK